VIGEKLINQRPRDPWLYIILLWTFVLRTYHLGYPAWDYHNWRQTITLMVARDFARHGFPLMHPQVAWLGNGPADPSYFSAEFSIQSVLAALLYKMLGESEVLARLVTIAFSLLGIYCLYNLLNRRAGRTAARLGAFIYAMLPYHLFFGRVFMPDIPALALALAGLDVLDRWTGDRSGGRLVTAAALTALAILQKLTVIFVGLPMIYLIWTVYGKALVRRKEPYIFAMVACLPAAAWYYAHGSAVASGSVLSALVMQRDLFARHLEVWVRGGFSLRILDALSGEAFSTVGFGLAVIGLIFAPRGRITWIFRLWVGGAALLLVLIPGVIASNLYYLSLLLPGGAALAAMVLAKLPGYGRATILVCFAAGAVYSALPMYQADRLPRELGAVLDSLTDPIVP
jgi:4-amino-4-deoxy-L-arabinose transferase-like glycosyltransferase